LIGGKIVMGVGIIIVQGMRFIETGQTMIEDVY